MALRVCSVPECPVLVESGRCADHRRAHRAQQGSRHERGYGTAHDRVRKRWAARVAAGETNCARCGNRISPLEPWDLDHTDDRTGYLGPSHRACNRAANHSTTRASRITLVVGAPCSGKTTYVRENMEHGDIVLDFDTLASALGSPVEYEHDIGYIPFAMEAMDTVLATARRKGGRVWWIRCWPTDRDFARADETIWLPSDVRTCHDRATAERRPSSWYHLIEDWFDLHGHRLMPPA